MLLKLMNESGQSIEYMYSERLGDYVMVPSSVNRRECIPSCVDGFTHPVTPLKLPPSI